MISQIFFEIYKLIIAMILQLLQTSNKFYFAKKCGRILQLCLKITGRIVFTFNDIVALIDGVK